MVTKASESAFEALSRFDQWARAHRNPYYKGVEFGKPVPLAIIEKAQVKLGFRFPEGYVRLMVEHGPAYFDIQPAMEDGYYGTHDILAPADFKAAHARVFGRDAKREDDDPGVDFLHHVVFQYVRDEDEGDGYTFYPTPEGSSEIYVSYHDEGGAQFLTADFDAHIVTVVDELLANVQEALKAWTRKHPGLKKITVKSFLEKSGYDGLRSEDIKKAFYGKGHVSLDRLEIEDDKVAVFIDGDLDIRGSLTEWGPLVVTGRLRARDAYLNRGVKVGGLLEVGRFLWLGGYCSSIKAAGLSSPLTILDSHDLEVPSDAVNCPCVIDNTTFKSPPIPVHYKRKDLKRILGPDLLDDGSACYNEIRDRLEADETLNLMRDR